MVGAVLSALSAGFFLSVNICRRCSGIYQKLLSWGAGQKQRSEILCSWCRARAQKTLFASVYTAMSGPNTCTLCNQTRRVWSVFVKVFRRVKATSHIGVKGILALKRALERLWRHQECARLYS